MTKMNEMSYIIDDISCRMRAADAFTISLTPCDTPPFNGAVVMVPFERTSNSVAQSLKGWECRGQSGQFHPAKPHDKDFTQPIHERQLMSHWMR